MPARIYVGTIGEGLFRSTDGGGEFWRKSEGMFVECDVRALAVHPHDDRRLYLGSEMGLFRSTDGADQWTRVDSPINDRQVWSIALDARHPEWIVVGTCPGKLFTSLDGGKTWYEGQADIRPDCPRIYWTRATCLLIDPEDPEIWWAGVEIDGLFRSRDRGRTWQRVGQGMTSQDIHSLAKVPGGPFLAATNNDLNRSDDGGETWRGIGIQQSLPWSYCRALAQIPGQPATILLGHGNGPPGSAGIIARSTDAGAGWQTVLPEPTNSTVWNFAVHPSDPGHVLASSVSGHLFESFDGGQSWTKRPREFGEIRALAWTPG